MTNSPSEDRVTDASSDDADASEGAGAAAGSVDSDDGAANGAPAGGTSGTTDPATTGEPDIEALLQELEQARAGQQRALADYRNLQRRSEQDRSEQSRLTLTAVVHSFLPVLDDMKRALDSIDSDLEGHQWVEGVRLVSQKFWSVLSGAGVREIPAVGEAFNPEVHEAVGYADGDDGVVVQLVQAGYSLEDRVIRPAMVLVGRSAETGDTGEADE